MKALFHEMAISTSVRLLLLALICSFIAACDQKGEVSEEQISTDSSATDVQNVTVSENDKGWPNVGGDDGKTFFSSLTQINRDNITTLGLAWEYDLGTKRGQEATPLVIGNILVTSGNLGRVYALDAVSGKELWTFIPKVDMQVNRSACCDQVNRGVAVKDSRVFVGSLDGILYALDLKSGEVLWQVNSLDGSGRGENITGAPEVAGDVVVIGNGGAEYGVRGYVTAFDLKTGEQRWRFYTVPDDPKLGPQHNPELEKALSTWKGSVRWDQGLGGTVWDAIHYDPQFDAVYIGVGNGGPYHYKKRASEGGDNLYVSSLVALDPATGRVKWHYQETPSDSWDFTATSPMTLTDLVIDGETVPALIHAPKNGFMYLIDRRNGKVLKAHSIVYQNWADGVDLETGRPNIRADLADYFNEPKIVFPATPGAKNWHPASYNPETGLYYSSVQELGNLIFTPPGDKAYRPKATNHDAGLIYSDDLLNILPGLPPFIQEAVKNSPEYERVKNGKVGAELRAINPLTGETVWSVSASSWQDRAGVLSTSGGLVFQGDVRGYFSIYDADKGVKLHTLHVGTAIIAAPMTYQINGVQYVAVLAGWGGGGWPYVPKTSATYDYQNNSRLLVFKLNGGSVPLPEKRPALEVAEEPPAQADDVTPEVIARGNGIFLDHCTMCHSNNPRTMSADLSRMKPAIHEFFEKIVLDGLFVAAGMPRWDDILSKRDVKDVHAYLIAEQKKKRAIELDLQSKGLPLDAAKATVLSSF